MSGQPIFFPGSRLLTVLLALITRRRLRAPGAERGERGRPDGRDRGPDAGRDRARRPALRRHDGAAHRRRRHAGRHLAAQLVHRHGRGNGRLRHRQPGTDHRRRSRRRLGRDPDQAHGRRHESVDRQHHGRWLRWWRRRCGRRRSGRPGRRRPDDRSRRRRDPARLRTEGHRGARVTASPSPRRSTRFASWPTCSKSAGSRFRTPSIRWRAACPAT